jgi:hypothetical protein
MGPLSVPSRGGHSRIRDSISDGGLGIQDPGFWTMGLAIRDPQAGGVPVFLGGLKNGVGTTFTGTR